MAKQTDDLDKMLADTLAGVMPQKKTQAGTTPTPKPPAPAPPPIAPPVAPQVAPPPAAAQPPKPKTEAGSVAFDRSSSGTKPLLRRYSAIEITMGMAKTRLDSAPETT